MSNEFLNGYKLQSNWYDATNELLEVNNNALVVYYYITHLWNKLNKPKIIGLPTKETMRNVHIKSDKTYYNAINFLIDAGLLLLVKKSPNHHVAPQYALLNYNENNNKLLRAQNLALLDALSKNDKVNNEAEKEYQKQLEKITQVKSTSVNNTEPSTELTTELSTELSKTYINSINKYKSLEMGIKEKEFKNSNPPPKKEKIDFDLISSWYKEYCPKQPQIRGINPPRKKKIQIKLKEMDNDLSIIKEIFEKGGKLAFLNGENNRGWKANFDWYFSNDKNGQSNWINILEGKYESEVNKDKPKKRHSELTNPDITGGKNDYVSMFKN